MEQTPTKAGKNQQFVGANSNKGRMADAGVCSCIQDMNTTITQYKLPGYPVTVNF
ncbi:MAG TPA: hypothetical protein VFG10_07830 [Saprospiraceae bacterium]|nr:hypothetical protein [Saprospiraceae bacterium]